MEEGTTNQELAMGATIGPGAHGEVNTEPEARARATVDPKALEHTIQNALENYLPRPESASDARFKFYDGHKRETDEHDKDFAKKCNADADTTLITASLLSAVASAFIVALQSQLQPDYTQLSYDLLWVMANSTGLQPPSQPSSDPGPWTGPGPFNFLAQILICLSLLVSLLAALVAVLAKQWLNHYSQINIHGSLVDYGRDRQRKMDGMATWQFKSVIECLPIMLQIALLLLGLGLSGYLFVTSDTIGWVALGFVVISYTFYFILSIVSSNFDDCPFQTPFSNIFLRARLAGREACFTTPYLHISSPKRRRRRRKPSDGNNGNEDIRLTMVGPPHHPAALVNQESDWEGYVLDSKCIAWMFKMSTDPDVILEIMKFIPEIIWHSDIKTTPLERLYDTVLECFDHSSGGPVVTSNCRNKAYISAKALVHLGIQRKCMGNESDAAVFASISSWHAIIGPGHYEGDSDLEHALGMVDRVFGAGNPTPMRWDKFSFTDSHHAWMAHILPHRARYALKYGPLPDDINEFLRHSLRRDHLPPAPIVSDCLLIIGLFLGIELDSDDQHVIKKSHKPHPQMNKIHATLVETFKDTTSTAPKIDHALEAMRLIAPLSESDIAINSHDLFHAIMRAPVSPAYTEEKKWEASRLAFHGAYKWDEVPPGVEDPKDILTFLSHHFKLAEKGKVHDEPIQDALRALAYASPPETIEALQYFDPTQPSFVRGICFVLQDIRPREVREAALLFLPLIAGTWFNAPDPIMTPDEMESLCADWASAVDEIGLSTPAVQKAALAVLLDMMNSPHWRPHIVPEKWKLLEYFTSAVPDDCQALRRCVDNTGLVKEISNMGNPEAVTLWSTILWLKYSELVVEVREWLEASARKARREDVDKYLSMIVSELGETERGVGEAGKELAEPGKELEEAGNELVGCRMSSTPHQKVIVHTAKIDSLKGAKLFLKSV